MVGYIYKYEKLLNQKVYIGQTIDIINRQSSHKYKARFVKSKFYNAVRKYGWENFSFCIVATVEADLEHITELLDKLEIDYIKQYNSYSKGYNSTFGGHSNRGALRNEDFKEYCRNRTYSKETRKKMSEAAKRRVVSSNTRQKLRENALNRNFASYRDQTTEKRNLGIRKALGAKTGSIMFQFLMEAVIITLLGGFIGIVLGVIGARGVCSLIAMFGLEGVTAKVDPLVVLSATIFSSLVGIFFGIYPAKKAAKLSPIEALRHE